MAQCISPFYKKETGMSFPCGKCYPCKARRVSGWSFRLLEEAKRSDSALFVTLTYNTDTVPISNKGYMTLDKTDLQKFFKRLRKRSVPSAESRVTRDFQQTNVNNTQPPRIKYYACGEYGTKGKRPHYHVILFNSNYKDVQESWKLGDVHFGTLTPASCAYTLKYISKDPMKKHQNDDREHEFSLMSKRMGDNYLTDDKIKWHRRHKTERFCITLKGGQKIALPRYYKQKIWNSAELQRIGLQFNEQAFKDYAGKNYLERLAFDEKNESLRKAYANANKETRRTTI